MYLPSLVLLPLFNIVLCTCSSLYCIVYQVIENRGFFWRKDGSDSVTAKASRWKICLFDEGMWQMSLKDGCGEGRIGMFMTQSA